MKLAKVLTALLVTFSFTAVVFVSPVQAAPPESIYNAACDKYGGAKKEKCAQGLLRKYPLTSAERQFTSDVAKMDDQFISTAVYKLLTIYTGKENCQAMTRFGAANDIDATYQFLRSRGKDWYTDSGIWWASTYIAGSFRFCKKHWPVVNAYFKEIY